MSVDPHKRIRGRNGIGYNSVFSAEAQNFSEQPIHILSIVQGIARQVAIPQTEIKISIRTREEAILDNLNIICYFSSIFTPMSGTCKILEWCLFSLSEFYDICVTSCD